MKKLLGILIVVTLGCGFAGTAIADPIAVGTFSGHTYKLYYESGGINWDDANALAISQGGYLVVLETSAENAFVAGLVAAYPSLYNDLGLGPWLGGFSQSNNDPFQWVNGAPFSSYPAPWQSGQPDWSEGGAMGLLYYNGGSKSGSNWGDYGQINGVGGQAGIVLGYVVEVPEPSLILLLGIGLGAISLVGWRRK
jgi:hypothetical protein